MYGTMHEAEGEEKNINRHTPKSMINHEFCDRRKGLRVRMDGPGNEICHGTYICCEIPFNKVAWGKMG